MYLKWALMVPISLFLTVISFPLALILPFFAKDGWLPKWLNWFQTPDNSLYGDDGWKTEHWMWRYKLPTFLATYVGIVGWLWRNPAYGFGCVYMTGIPIVATFLGNEKVNDSPLFEGRIIVYSQNLFQFVWCKKITSTKCLYFVFGWNIKGLINDHATKHIATYAFSPRVSTFKL
jgi:hypothetical protein